MTFSFQAPAFYAKRGFQVVAVVDDHPRGHKNILLRKRLGLAVRGIGVPIDAGA